MLSSLNPYERHKIRIIWSLLRYDVISSLQIYQLTSVSSHKVFLLMLLYCIKLYKIAHNIFSHLFMAPCLSIMIVGSRISRRLLNDSNPNLYISPSLWGVMKKIHIFLTETVSRSQSVVILQPAPTLSRRTNLRLAAMLQMELWSTITGIKLS